MKRTKSQKIGSRGESYFNYWANRSNLIPQKLSDDYGIDFLCQVQGKENSEGTSKIVGQVIGAFVRSTTKRNGEIRIDKKEAERLLECHFPVCIFLIHSIQRDREILYFSFICDRISEKLALFLKSSKNSLKLRPIVFLDEKSFRSELLKAIEPGYVEIMRLNLANKMLSKNISENRIEVRRSPRGEYTLIHLKSYFNQFDLNKGKNKEFFQSAIFGLDDFMPERLAKLSIHNEMLRALRYVPGPVFIIGNLDYRKTKLEVSGNNGNAQCTFEVRKTNDHFGFVHESGLSIIISKAVLHEGKYVHWIEGSVDQKSAAALDDLKETKEFLLKCIPSAKINEIGKESIFSVDYSEVLYKCGFFARYYDETVSWIKWPKGTWLLRDAMEMENLNTLGFLSKLSKNKSFLDGFGFMIKKIDERYTQKEEKLFKIPICLNLPRSHMVVWLNIKGFLFIYEDKIIGIKINNLLSLDYEIKNNRLSKSIWPEIVVTKYWPSIQFGQKNLEKGTDKPDWGYSMIINENI
ncbi:MAG: hypothetical protein NT009_11285 [Proteobacteria bacterium]|nr:hypothetical protein [Pseudomonadota bacterium]